MYWQLKSLNLWFWQDVPRKGQGVIFVILPYLNIA